MPSQTVIATPYKEASILHLAQGLDRARLLMYIYLPTALPHQFSRLSSTILPNSRLNRWIAGRTVPYPARSLMPIGDLRTTLARKRRPAQAAQILRQGGERFDYRSRKYLEIDMPAAYVGMPYASMHSFQFAQANRILSVLNHVNSVWVKENEAYEEELTTVGTHQERLDILREQRSASQISTVAMEVSLADYVLVPSTIVWDHLISTGTVADKLILLPYGVDTRKFKYVARDNISRPLRVLYVGQVGYRKGLRYLDQAIQISSSAVSSFDVVGPVVNGTGLLQRLASSFHYTPLASQHELAANYYRSADVFVLPSLSDSFGLVVLEAMATGLPVIVTSDTGASDLIRHGENGFVVPSRDPAAIAEHIHLLANDGDLRVTMGHAARETAEQHSWSQFENTFVNELLARYPALRNHQL